VWMAGDSGRGERDGHCHRDPRNTRQQARALPLAAPYVAVMWVCALVQPVHASEAGEARPHPPTLVNIRLPRNF